MNLNLKNIENFCENNKNIVITIDGPAGAGKGTVTRMLSNKLPLIYVEWGSVFRTVALLASKMKVNIDSEDELIHLIHNSKIDFSYLDNQFKIYLYGEDVSEYIRTPEISKASSKIASSPTIHKELTKLLHKLVNGKNILIEGRATGSAMFQNAFLKVYLDASIEERATRRFNEWRIEKKDITLDYVINQIKERDFLDTNREYAPLKCVENAIYIDSSTITPEEVCEIILKEIINKIESRSNNDETKL